MRGGGKDVAGGAVISFQPDHLGAGKVVLEAQDVVDLGAAPAVDRLVVIADAADVFQEAAGGRCRGNQSAARRALAWSGGICGSSIGLVSGSIGGACAGHGLDAGGSSTGYCCGSSWGVRSGLAGGSRTGFLSGGGVGSFGGMALSFCSRRAAALSQQAQPEILGDVGVLIFVDQDKAKARLIFAQHVR